jgi:Rrf2 family protein
MNLECDYAIRIVYVIANANDRIDAKTISERSCVSLRFALKILRKLVMGSIVVSFMGTNGGYKLAKSPNDVTIYDVIYAINGEYYFNRCVDDEYVCSRMGNSRCPFSRIFDSITEDTVKVLKSYHFGMFLDNDSASE